MPSGLSTRCAEFLERVVMINKVCANLSCNRPAAHKIKMPQGGVQYRCETCYKRRVAASRAAPKKEKK